MDERMRDLAQNEFRGTRMRIFGTDADNPDEGRIFIWTKSGWFERIEGESGGVAFIPVAQSEDELRKFISRDDPSFDLVPLGREYRKRVSEEFTEQSPSYRDSSEYSNKDDFEEDQQQYHQHE